MIGFAIFVLLPIVISLVLSFHSWDLLTPPKFIGTGNFGFEGDLRVVFTNGNTLIQGNTDTDSTPEFEIQLNGLHTISSTDFIL